MSIYLVFGFEEFEVAKHKAIKYGFCLQFGVLLELLPSLDMSFTCVM